MVALSPEHGEVTAVPDKIFESQPTSRNSPTITERVLLASLSKCRRGLTVDAHW